MTIFKSKTPQWPQQAGEPPAYHEDGNSELPRYDFTVDEKAAVADEKKRIPPSLSPDRSPDATAEASSSSSSSSDPITWRLELDAPFAGSLAVFDATDPSKTLYRISYAGRAPQIDLSSRQTGAQLGTASFQQFSRVVTFDIHDVKEIDMRPVDMRRKDYSWSSPSFSRRLQWHWKGPAGLGGLVCKDERGDEVAKWEGITFSFKKVAKMTFSRWVTVGREEVVRRRMEELLLTAAAMGKMQELTSRGMMPAPGGPVVGGAFLSAGAC